MRQQIYWGDLHSHCNMSYGYGSLERAYAVAKQQLDFCSVTGHALWPDMPEDRDQYGRIIDYHSKGFAKLAANWSEFCRITRAWNTPGKFVAFPSYEWHSIAHGDYNVYLPAEGGDILDGASPEELAERLATNADTRGGGALILPHHIGYGPGRRGINWDTFDGRRSPAVEMYSGHGGSEREGAPFAMYHTMGPRCVEGLASTGLRRGHRFAFTAGTDHHAGYPGSYGTGRTAVLADELTQESLWSALRSRRCYAVTGDKIALTFSVNDGRMGDVVPARARQTIRCRIVGDDVLDCVDVIRNDRIIARRTRADAWPPAETHLDSGTTRRSAARYKIRVEWGWGEVERRASWTGELRLAGGRIVHCEPYFRGDEVLAPSEDAAETIDEESIPHEISALDESSVAWRSRTRGNPMPMVASTSSFVVEVEASPQSRLEFLVNGNRFSHTVAELLEGSRSTLMRGWLSEAVLVHRAVPEKLYTLIVELDDDFVEPAYYYVRVAQQNGQWAWGSPIWVD